MGKMVRYNGDTLSYYGTSDVKQLQVGKVYEVISIEVKDWQTNYYLHGVKGCFNSVWFETVEENKPDVYMAVSIERPNVGKSYHCSKMVWTDDGLEYWKVTTSPVEEVEYIGNRVYKVKTLNSIYMVLVDE